MKRFFPNTFRNRLGFNGRRLSQLPKKFLDIKYTLNPKTKKEMVASGFGRFVPQASTKELRKLKEAAARGQLDDKDIAYFGRQLKGEHVLGTKEEQLRFARGFLKEAHAAGMPLRAGYNPSGREWAQAQRLIKEQREKFSKEHTPPPRPAGNEPRTIDIIRQRSGVLHAGNKTALPTMTQPIPVQEPTPLGQKKTGLAESKWKYPAKSIAGMAPEPEKPPHRSSPFSSLKGGAQYSRVGLEGDEHTVAPYVVRPSDSSGRGSEKTGQTVHRPADQPTSDSPPTNRQVDPNESSVPISQAVNRPPSIEPTPPPPAPPSESSRTTSTNVGEGLPI